MLIPAFGVVGAAIASATTLSLQMIIATIMVWQKLGILTISLGRGDDSAWV